MTKLAYPFFFADACMLRYIRYSCHTQQLFILSVHKVGLTQYNYVDFCVCVLFYVYLFEFFL